MPDFTHQPAPETIGKRIARLRAERGWTQQALASRLAISRVAVSHIEMDLSIPSERTVILLAGLFKIEPHALVEATTYPQAKAERLPPTALAYTQAEVELALLANDLAWIEAVSEDRAHRNRIARALNAWAARLERFDQSSLDDSQREQVLTARRALRAAAERLGLSEAPPDQPN
ncbi:MAG: helix-turn-helix domain-containing protein [Anaerolineales bacterium]|jgi:transcriptional regulator with XRE-family HTH domain|nr:helix-turn-helix domain-containing protein [Anaerolineales bacterium]